MHVFQTEGAPPSNGRSIFATSGCTQKSSAALVNKASAKTGASAEARVAVVLTRFSSTSMFICLALPKNWCDPAHSGRTQPSITGFNLLWVQKTTKRGQDEWVMTCRVCQQSFF